MRRQENPYQGASQQSDPSLAPGLSREQLEHISRRGSEVCKVSRRDLPKVVAKGLDGATTVSATMLLASMAGISVFVTGGIGGVHRF